MLTAAITASRDKRRTDNSVLKSINEEIALMLTFRLPSVRTGALCGARYSLAFLLKSG